MPRIDPLSLLKCLSVLLGPTGGIKSKDEVHRLANLMTKFSKKLVSKCIYIQILKTTNSELLSQFMSAGGWNLIHMWLSDGILTKNWALVQELLELLLLCPVDIERLKSNNCPKLIKGLSKEAKDLTVRASASKLVDQWLKIVKGEVAPNSIPQQIEPTTAINNLNTQSQEDMMLNKSLNNQELNDDTNIDQSTIPTNDLNLQINCDQQYQDNNLNINIQPVQLQIVNKTFPGQTQATQISKQSFVVVNPGQNQQTTGSVYKIIIKDGKNVLSKVETDQKNIKNLYKTNDCVNNIDSNIKNDDDTNKINDGNLINNCDDVNVNGIVDKCEVTNIDCNNLDANNTIDDGKSNDNKDNISSSNSSSDVNKSSDKENRDSRKKDDKSTDKKSSSHHSSSSSSKSKHSSSSSSRSSSSSHRSSSHRSSSSSSSKSSSKSSKDRDKHHSSSSKHSSSSSSSSSRNKSDKDKEKEKEKEKLKKDQAEKDKATLEKVQGQSLSTKFGKIPKKKIDDDKNDTTSLRKSSTDSRDSSKENKDDKKLSSSTGFLEKKNISMSIENRKNSTDSTRPKTVKTFHSKFRSTGLEEEVKPPPSRSATAKKSTSQINDKKPISLKRPSPLRETPIIDKKAKLSLEPPATMEEKKGAIKLIAPKPKPMVLQESDMFMDALMTASTKSKEPRKRKRRTSLTKDDTKKLDDQGGKEGGSSPPSSSPQTADERSPLPVKPDFKFYQDTLETDEDKEDKEKSQDDEEAQEENEKNRGNSDEDDERSQTPTCDDNPQDEKDTLEDSFGTQHNPLSPNSEIRYVDGLRSVLVLQKRKGPKKLLKWKTDLESIRYFELDETERVNVTKTFTDMKQIEKQNERQAFQKARKLSTEDTMEEKTQWRLLIKIDLPPALVEPGKDSKERDIQYAREKGILQALYFNHGMIPDSPAEPDEERHHVMNDPIIIPLDDLTGNKESEKDYSMMTWPEAKLSSLSTTTPAISAPINLPTTVQSHQQSILPQNIHYQQFNQHNQIVPGMQNGSMGMTQLPPGILPMNSINEINSSTGGGGWRTGDGKVVVPDINMAGGGSGMPGFPPSNMDPSLITQGMIPPPGLYSQSADSFTGILGNDDNNFGHMQNNFQGPGGIFNNFRGGSGGQIMANRGRGGPGWFRGTPGPVGPPVRGAWNAGGRGNWRGNGKQICRQFTKNGYCRVGDKCQYLHPGVNCPPF